MNAKQKENDHCDDEDEVTTAKSILDELIEDIDREDEEKPQDKPAAKKQTDYHLN